LEEKVDEISKHIIKKKKKINVLEWLNNNITPSITFEHIPEKIIVIDSDIEKLFDNSFIDVLNGIFERSIYNFENEEKTIYAFIQKANTFYIYDSIMADKNINDNNIIVNNNNVNNIWFEITREKLLRFLSKIHMKITKVFYEWKAERKQEIKNNDNLAIKLDKTLVKLMGVDFRQESTLVKIKTLMYSRFKADMKAFIEYEFEF